MSASPNLTDGPPSARPSGRGSASAASDGERWSRDLLDRLREERFSPAAWRQFFAEAFARARRVRGERPADVRRSRRWGAAGLVAALPFGPRAALWWAGWWAMLDWHIGMLDGRAPGAADGLTLARLWLVPVVRRHPSAMLLATALASDAADGALARRAGPTRLGRDLDSTADTALLSAALGAAVRTHGLDRRLLELERARLALGTAVILRSYFGTSAAPPAQRGRRLPALLAAAGAVCAVRGHVRVAEPLLAASIGHRALTRVRAS